MHAGKYKLVMPLKKLDLIKFVEWWVEHFHHLPLQEWIHDYVLKWCEISRFSQLKSSSGLSWSLELTNVSYMSKFMINVKWTDLI